MINREIEAGKSLIYQVMPLVNQKAIILTITSIITL